MAYNLTIERAVATGLRTKSIFVMIENDSTAEFRLYELTGVPLGADDETAVTAAVTGGLTKATMYANGKTLDPTEIEGRKDRLLLRYYGEIIRSIDRQFAIGGTVDEAIAVARIAILTNATRGAEFTTMAQKMGLANVASLNADQKNAALLLARSWALEGVVRILVLGR